jgi:RNA polymerase sigma factor (sigma-70 family)
MKNINNDEYNELVLMMEKSFSHYNISADDKYDIIINSLIKALEVYDDTKGATLKTFLYRITQNNINDFLRKTKNVYIEDYEYDIIEYILNDDYDGFNDDVDFIFNNQFFIELEVKKNENDIKIIMIKDEIENSIDADILKDFYFNQKTIKEISKKYNSNDNTIKSKLYRFRKKVKYIDDFRLVKNYNKKPLKNDDDDFII